MRRSIERRVKKLELNPADLPKVGLPTVFTLLETEWEWIDRDRRILQTEDGERYCDPGEFLGDES